MSDGSATGGSLVVVGIGMQLGRHAGQRALSEIDVADDVFALVDAFALDWLQRRRPDCLSLHGHYAEGKDRRLTYREMIERVLVPARAGRRVCLVLYGHPGVFADVPHEALRRASAEGLEARMEPGVSAEACLYADLLIDPGSHGVQSFEATQFLIHHRRVDPSALLILWQVALCGDLGCSRFETTVARLELLVEKLRGFYPREPEIILYEAARLPIERPRADRMMLGDLPLAALVEHTTLVIPPAGPLEKDHDMLAALARTEEP